MPLKFIQNKTTPVILKVTVDLKSLHVKNKTQLQCIVRRLKETESLQRCEDVSRLSSAWNQMQMSALRACSASGALLWLVSGVKP